MRNPPSWLVIFLVIPFNKIPLFSKGLITFIISFISLFFRVIPEPSLNVQSFLSLFISLVTKYVVVSLVYLGAPFINSCVLALIAAYDKATSNSLRIPSDCTF